MSEFVRTREIRNGRNIQIRDRRNVRTEKTPDICSTQKIPLDQTALLVLDLWPPDLTCVGEQEEGMEVRNNQEA